MKQREKIVLASGTFDLIHLGHVKYLEDAKKAGGKNAKLIVIVARDKTVEKRKGLNIQVVKIKKFGKPELNSSRKIKKKVTELYKR